jgi:hypothetical protein
VYRTSQRRAKFARCWGSSQDRGVRSALSAATAGDQAAARQGCLQPALSGCCSPRARLAVVGGAATGRGRRRLPAMRRVGRGVRAQAGSARRWPGAGELAGGPGGRGGGQWIWRVAAAGDSRCWRCRLAGRIMHGHGQCVRRSRWRWAQAPREAPEEMASVGNGRLWPCLAAGRVQASGVIGWPVTEPAQAHGP